MQEVFEGLVKEGLDMYDDAIRHTDVVEFLKYIKVQRALAENHRLGVHNNIDKPGVVDDEIDDEWCLEEAEFSRIVETFDYVIDLIESGRFAKAYDDVVDFLDERKL